MQCPFCKKLDFDEDGLAYHLDNYCELYKKVLDKLREDHKLYAEQLYAKYQK